MQVIKLVLFTMVLTIPLSGCYTMAVGAAGAGAGYIYKEKEEKGEID